MTGALEPRAKDGPSPTFARTEDDVVYVRAQVEHAAEEAARDAGVVIRELSTVADLEAVVDLYDRIWKRDEGPLLTAQLLRAFAKAGNYVVGAFDGPTLIGACVGFFAAPADGALHSHIAGVSATARRRHVGLAIKLHQRAWALQRGASTIGWTFDPLVARNAWFNIGRLGAVPVEYLTDFYGGMHDGINGPDSSDRLLVHWDLTSPLPAAVGRRSGAGRAEPHDGADASLGISDSGAPVRGPTRTPVLLVAVPADVESLRVTHPHLASQWRSELRASLGGLLAAGGRIEGFDRRGWYVVRQGPPRPAAERTEEGGR